MTDQHTRIVRTREEAHEAITRAYGIAKGLLADGKRAKITVGEDNDPITVRQRRFLHGPVLEQISLQVVIDGQRYVQDVWKRYYKNLILERNPRYEMIRMPGKKRATPKRKWWSTEELSVKQYSHFIDEIIAHATTEFSVPFQFEPGEREAARYRQPHRHRSNTDERITDTRTTA